MSTPLRMSTSKVVIPRKGTYFTRRNFFLYTVSLVLILSMIIPLVIADTWCRLYHTVYFWINDMPKVPRDKYILIDRGRLKGLNIVQRFNCMYCDYANGAIAWMKAVINTTEVYSCAIKHSSKRAGQDHQEGYYAYEQFQ